MSTGQKNNVISLRLIYELAQSAIALATSSVDALPPIS